MSATKTSLSTRLLRSLRAVRFLFTALWRLHKIDPDNPAQRGHVINAIGALGLQMLNVKLEFDHQETPAGGPPEPDNGRGMLIVANHVSWLDIFILATLYPCSFIGMKEIKRWPIIGTVARNAGTVFIDRKNRKDIDPINAAIAASLEKGQSVMFFPKRAPATATACCLSKPRYSNPPSMPMRPSNRWRCVIMMKTASVPPSLPLMM